MTRLATTESSVLAGCLSLLAHRGVPAWRSNAGAGLRPKRDGGVYRIKGAPPDSPDIIGWLPARDMGWGQARDGRLLGLEIKRPGEMPRPGQLAWLRQMNADGAVGLWVTAVDQLDHALDRLLAGAAVELDEAGWPYLVDLPACERCRGMSKAQ